MRWPERHDCALLTSKGFASRAARDVIDFLGGTGEDLTFYCIHDADAAGTMIHQALEQATRARPARKVKIVNLGLEPAEALEMGLQVERVEHEEKGEGKLAPVAAYVPPEWANWLQANRVELNAMTTPQFLGWLDAKFAGQVGKVVPPWDVLADRLRADVRGVLDRQYTRSILAENDKDGRVDAAFGRLRGTIEGRLTTLRDEVEDGLADDPSRSWPAPLAGVAAAIAMGPDDESDTP